jgi:hypothetical protein
MLNDVQALIRVALDYYWKFMFEHPFLGVLLTLSVWGWIVSGIRALKGLSDPPAPNPPITLTRSMGGTLPFGLVQPSSIAVTQPPALQEPAPDYVPDQTSARSHYDRLLSED